MARRNRTAEILAAANLVPLEIAREQEQTRRASATSQALASLVPALIQGGVDIYGGVTKAQREDALQTKKDERADKDALADIAAQKATTDAQKARADAMKARAEADKVKATTDAAEATRKAEGELSKTTSEQSMAALRAAAAAPGAKLETLIGRASVDPGLGNLDDTAVSGIFAEEQAKARREGAGAKLAERKAAAPLGPKAPSADQSLRSEKLKLEVEKLRNEQAGGPGSSTDKTAKASTDKKKQQVLEVDNYVGNIKRNIKLIKDQIAKTGTFELTGPEGAVNERRLTEIATDMAKLADPGSVAREGEVMLMRKGLVDTGIGGAFTRDDTAQAVLDALSSDVDRRREEAYLVRGLEMGASATGAEADAAELGFTIDED